MRQDYSRTITFGMDAEPMTKEHKLALVTGFGFMLLVGIVISDHFSVARMQTAADLRPAGELMNTERNEDPALIAFSPPQPPPQKGQSVAAPKLRSAVQSKAAGPARINMPDLQQGRPRIGGDRGGVTRDSGQVHRVRSGESLSSICQKYYGDSTLVIALAQFNHLGDPDLLREGKRLRIPERGVLGGGAVDPLVKQGGVSRVATYTVRSGDVLSDIAKREMGSAGRMMELYRFNRAVIDDPDRLRVGDVLRIPGS